MVVAFLTTPIYPLVPVSSVKKSFSSCCCCGVSSTIQQMTTTSGSSSSSSSSTTTTSWRNSQAPATVERTNPIVPQPTPGKLAGDPSLILTTNIDLGPKKRDIMKSISKSIAKFTDKPEEYVAVCIQDKSSVIFGGSDAPTALGVFYSLGAVNQKNNGSIQKAVTDLLEEFGVDESRIYINFFDMAPENCGWSRATFADFD